MKDLRILKSLVNLDEDNERFRLRGDLVCKCGCTSFKVFHTGKQTKAILTPSYIHFVEEQLALLAVCNNCGEEIEFFDSNIDGRNATITEDFEYDQFLYGKNKSENFKLSLMFHYDESKFKNANTYTNCFENFTCKANIDGEVILLVGKKKDNKK